ncbi:MAG: HAD family hydrolase [Coriobacteriales bacterium]|nr:HAD family hydrolase [Coriobacteriales bacterium]
MRGNKHASWQRLIAMVAAITLAFVGIVGTTGCAQPQASSATSNASAASNSSAESNSSANSSGNSSSVEEALSYWTETAPLKTQLATYVASVTDESSKDFIPAEDRIAVFDFDGTLFNETDPNYFDHMLLVYRVLEDPDYKDKASDFEKEVANKIVDQNTNGTKYENLPTEHGKAVASAFKGMTPAEFSEYVQKFKETDMPSYKGMKRGYGFYLPMIQVVEYLEANDFTVYVVSGTDRLITRGIFSGTCPLSIPAAQIIGSDETLVATNQGETDGLEYTYTSEDKLVTGGEFIIKNLKMNKVSAIEREIGQVPVLSFGNSSGDYAMANYTLSNSTYKTMAFQLCCDDLERENGNTSKADDMYAACEKNGYTPISMKNDWTTIYGDDVTYLGAKKDEATSASGSASASGEAKSSETQDGQLAAAA